MGIPLSEELIDPIIELLFIFEELGLGLEQGLGLGIKEETLVISNKSLKLNFPSSG
jgi:hypothetical protein